MGKSRVAPTKYTSIPRLEPAAAVLSIKVTGMIKKELAIEEVSEYFWTDSQVVIGYIINSKRRLKIVVANRLQQIKKYSNPAQWNYVTSNMNPVDYASRGLSGVHHDLWFNGPKSLWKSEF